MDILEKVAETEILGRDFLVWLWFKSDTNGGIIDLGGDKKVEIFFDGKITLQTDGEEALEKITCSGINPRLREARFALTEDKKVTQSSVKLIMDEEEWSFVLDSTWLNYRSFKSPRIEQDSENDPDGLFYEKIGLLEKAVNAVDSVFGEFVKRRVSDKWKSRELPALRKWVNEMRKNI